MPECFIFLFKIRPSGNAIRKYAFAVQQWADSWVSDREMTTKQKANVFRKFLRISSVKAINTIRKNSESFEKKCDIDWTIIERVISEEIYVTFLKYENILTVYKWIYSEQS